MKDRYTKKKKKKNEENSRYFCPTIPTLKLELTQNDWKDMSLNEPCSLVLGRLSETFVIFATKITMEKNYRKPNRTTN